MQPLFWPEISIKGKLRNKFCLVIDYCDINGIWVPQEVTQVHWTRRMRITTIAQLPTMVGPRCAGDSFIVSVLYLPTFIYHYAQILCKDLRFRNYKRKYGTGTVDLFLHRSLWFSLELVYRSSVNHSSQSYLNIAILAPKSSSVEPAETAGASVLQISSFHGDRNCNNANDWTLVSLWTSLRGCTLLYFFAA